MHTEAEVIKGTLANLKVSGRLPRRVFTWVESRWMEDETSQVKTKAHTVLGKSMNESPEV